MGDRIRPRTKFGALLRIRQHDHGANDTLDETVALLKEYDLNFDPQHIVKSQRGGIEYIVAEKQA